MKKRRITSVQESVWSFSERDVLVKIAAGNARHYEPNTIRQRTKVFHRHIIESLIHDRLLRRQDIPKGRSFVEQQMVNYLRHTTYPPHKGKYKKLLDDAILEIGFESAYSLINNAVLKEIGWKYAYLRNACERQRSGTLYIEPADIFRPFFRDPSNVQA